jgi:hypothetical protein
MLGPIGRLQQSKGMIAAFNDFKIPVAFHAAQNHTQKVQIAEDVPGTGKK